MPDPTLPSLADSNPSAERTVRVAMVTGEVSGDILGAGLMLALQERFPQCRFEGIGGERMLSQGFHSFFNQDRLAVMGLVEPLKRLPELLRMRRFLREHFLKNPPDVFIGIDSPDFNLDLELALRQGGIKTAHYVSPSVWAWRQGRVKKIAKAVDLMLTLLPFEAEFYQRHNIPVAFVGHPLADKISFEADNAGAKQELSLHANLPCVALLPGSRANEVALLGRVFLETAQWCLQSFGPMQFIIPSANPSRHAQLQELLKDFPELPVRLVEGQSQRVMAAADVVLMASGTTSLEALLLKRPMVIAYKMAPLSFAILSRLVKVASVGLPNLLAGKPLVPELLQEEANPAKLGEAVVDFLRDPQKVERLQDEYQRIHRDLKQDADHSAAEAVSRLILSASGEQRC